MKYKVKPSLIVCLGPILGSKNALSFYDYDCYDYHDYDHDYDNKFDKINLNNRLLPNLHSPELLKTSRQMHDHHLYFLYRL